MVLNRCFVQMWLVFFCLRFAFPQKRTTIFCNPDWSQMAAAVPAERADPVSHIRVGFFMPHLISFQRVSEERYFFSGNLREDATLLAPMWLMNIICRILCGAVLVTLRAWKAMATNYPPPPSQGQGWWVCRGSWSLDLLCCASPFLCQDGARVSTRTNGENPVCHVCLPVSWLRPHLDVSFFGNPRNIITSWRITKWFQMQIISVHPIPGLLNYSVDESTSQRVTRMQNVCRSGV